ncbi:MAG: GNAT family N-acetyltransferase [Clostridiales bacterium GWB2_37_7]|nr:MAG: GNAT family N-acetyltransferase [Clostridiales bacterium GWB2_37_7]
MLFSGQLVNLRAFRDEDIKPSVDFMNDMEIILNLDDDAPMPQSYETQKEWFEEMRKNKKSYKDFFWAIETKDAKFIGGCGVNRMDGKNRLAQVGIFIGNQDYLGKGYGTDAMKVLLEFLFEEYNVNKVKLLVFDYNKRAIKSYEKCGFQTEAIYRDSVFRYGKYQDMRSMAILKEEYFNR